ncbi:hypothetical protein SAMD00019534_003470 [Acytostelium subglobosum LB1]|uniref:hypothetical protein n=1 Tax=Acytostelium subglobosum LB1 TaxID=1410327 RepID=UPI000644DEE1|nr:hypothetical protein SAMD00019534_003470 [Acytostelium subglobosum LB1]GAM17172.1 hypothetical protein SAMD00019534_003470 [Acytostelium subglobosum LB1]|eukprot:XP_012759234.1 hypothetical protein SAMD00019534_003470 [Acytostelium subglobosum LB1]
MYQPYHQQTNQQQLDLPIQQPIQHQSQPQQQQQQPYHPYQQQQQQQQQYYPQQQQQQQQYQQQEYNTSYRPTQRHPPQQQPQSPPYRPYQLQQQPQQQYHVNNYNAPIDYSNRYNDNNNNNNNNRYNDQSGSRNNRSSPNDYGYDYDYRQPYNRGPPPPPPAELYQQQRYQYDNNNINGYGGPPAPHYQDTYNYRGGPNHFAGHPSFNNNNNYYDQSMGMQQHVVGQQQQQQHTNYAVGGAGAGGVHHPYNDTGSRRQQPQTGPFLEEMYKKDMKLMEIPPSIDAYFKAAGVLVYTEHDNTIKVLMGCEDRSAKKRHPSDPATLFLPFGGKVEKGETAVDTATREFNEETAFIFGDRIDSLPQRFLDVDKNEMSNVDQLYLEWIDLKEIFGQRQQQFARPNGETGHLISFFLPMLGQLKAHFRTEYPSIDLFSAVQLRQSSNSSEGDGPAHLSMSIDGNNNNNSSTDDTNQLNVSLDREQVDLANEQSNAHVQQQQHQCIDDKIGDDNLGTTKPH